MRAFGTACLARLMFTGGSDCSLQQATLPNGKIERGSGITREYEALFELLDGLANCNVTKTPDSLKVCGTGNILDDSIPSDFSISCTADPQFSVAVLSGEIEILVPSGTQAVALGAGKDFVRPSQLCTRHRPSIVHA